MWTFSNTFEKDNCPVVQDFLQRLIIIGFADMRDANKPDYRAFSMGRLEFSRGNLQLRHI